VSVHKYFLPPTIEGGKPRARWRVNFDLPPDPETGKRRRGTRKGFTTEKKAREKDLEPRGQIADGIVPVPPGERATVAEWRSWPVPGS
jgi:hypothetical protein